MSTLPTGAGFAVSVAAGAVVGGAALLERWLALDAPLVERATALAVGGGLFVLWLAAMRLRAATFGAANTVTLVRGALTLLLLALLGVDAGAPLAWAVVALAVLAVALDGVDGRLARRRGETSAFGARFDMETDALLILVLAALVWQHGKAGPWILLAGLLRYVFVAASYAWPALRHELPPSRRRQAVCVVQIVSLVAALAPVVAAPASAVIALAGLVLLAWSFAVDVAWLARRGRSRPTMNEAQPLKVRHWLALAAALFVLNACVTFHNVWPTPWITLRSELSLEIAVLLAALVAWSAFVRPPGRLARAALTLLVLILVIGRYAEVTAPALYGRPVNLYWDAEHLPKVAAMLAEVAPWWLVALLVVGTVVVLAALVAAIAWCLAQVARGLRARATRRALGLASIGVVGLYAVSHAFEWPARYRYSAPVSATYLQQAQFFLAARAADQSRSLPLAPPPPSDFGRLDGEDVLVVFLESYGAVSYDTPAIARVVAPARDELAHAAAETDRHVVSAFVSSPTFGGASWLAHASFMSGIEVRDTGDYMLLLTQQRDTLPKLFKAAGYRAIAVMPGLKNEWPEGAFYGFDAMHGERALDYRGPDFGWWRIPDQFALASVAVIEARNESHAPLFTFLPTINTHIPFLPVPPYQVDWQRLLTDDPYDAPEVAASLAREPDWEALSGPYAESFAYTFTYLAGYLRQRAGADELLVLIGDHQPAASVAGLGARWEVPVHIVTQRADVAADLVAAGFVEGVALAPQQRPLGTLPDLLALLLRTLDSAR